MSNVALTSPSELSSTGGKTVWYVERGKLKPYALKEGEFLKTQGYRLDFLNMAVPELFHYFRFLGAKYEDCSIHTGHFSYKLDGYMVYYSSRNAILSFFVVDKDFDEELAFFKEVVPRDTVLKDSDLMTELGKYTEFASYILDSETLVVHSNFHLKKFVEWINN